MLSYIRHWKRRGRIKQHLAFDGRYRFRGGVVDVPDSVSLKIRAKIASGDYENSECALIEAFLPRDRPVVELGGCLGLVSNFVARQLLPEIPLVVVEANPALYEVCARNATIGNSRDNVIVKNVAIAYNGGDVQFAVSDNIHVSRLGQTNSLQTIPLPGRTLAQILEEFSINERYSLIADIEGAEIDLIDNDGPVLSKCDLMIIELHPPQFEKAGRSLEQVVSAIEDLGFVERRRLANVFAFERLDGDKSA